MLATPGRAVALVAAVTVTSVLFSLGASLAVLWWLGVEPTPMHFAFTIGMPAVGAPLWAVPLVWAGYRLQRAKSELDRLAWTDSLTGLPNRRAFFRRAARAYAVAEHRGDPVAVLMIDVDHFKAVNDNHGHDVGDEVLERIARAVDGATAPAPGAFAARIGGEEFAVVIPGADEAGAIALAERVGEAVRRLGHVANGAAVRTTVSVGVASRVPGQDVDATLRAADAAVYEAKRQGRDRWALAAPRPAAAAEAPPARQRRRAA